MDYVFYIGQAVFLVGIVNIFFISRKLSLKIVLIGIAILFLSPYFQNEMIISLLGDSLLITQFDRNLFNGVVSFSATIFIMTNIKNIVSIIRIKK